VAHQRFSAYERWTWRRCSEQILTLKHRLGYGERLWILGFELLDNGRLVDPFHGVEVFNPHCAGLLTAIPSQYSAVPEMYCILSTYAAADETPLSGEKVSLASLDPMWRSELSEEDCGGLLKYTHQDFSVLQMIDVPFFGETLKRGDIAFDVWPLPRVPVTLVLWQGDEEVADGGTLLFDRTITHYIQGLVRELAWLTIWRLRNILDPEVKWGYHQLSNEVKTASSAPDPSFR
jgi:hypothetical protein